MSSIVLVPSDPETSERLSSAMRQAGHEVLVAITWRDAYRRALEGGIGAVVVDSFDPRVGAEHLARGLAGRPGAPPIVLVSSSPVTPALSRQIGVTAFLPKPYELHTLLSLVNRLTGTIEPNHDFKDEVATEEIQLAI